MSVKDQSSWFNPVAVALDVRPKRVFQPVWTRCFQDGILWNYTAASLYFKLKLSLLSQNDKCQLFRNAWLTPSAHQLFSHTVKWGNGKCRDMRSSCGFVVTCFERLCFGLLWWLTGALPAGERMIIMAYITLFSIPLSQGVACPGHCHSQQYKRCCSPGYQLQLKLPKTNVLETPYQKCQNQCAVNMLWVFCM